MNDFDVTIIGAGLAGLQCARLLGKQGFRVLLVDRKHSLEQRIHTTGIFVRRTLHDFDVPEDFLGPAIRHVSLFSPSHRELKLESDNDEFRIGRMSRLYSWYLDQCLLKDVSWLPNTNYLDHEEKKGDLSIRLRRGTDTFSVHTRYLVGCDGARSRVAETLNLDVNREWIVGVEDVYRNVRIAGLPRLYCFLDPEVAPGYIAWIAHDGAETHVGVGGYPRSFDPLNALEKFQAKVRDIVDLEYAERVERRGGRIPVGGVLRRICNERGLLIGDAAGAASPLTAGGLDPCMRLSAMAAKVVSRYLETNDPDVLTGYSGELFRARFTSRLWARRLASQLTQSFWAELTCAVLRLPLLKELARHVFFGRGSFPDIEVEHTAVNCGTRIELPQC